MEEGRRAAAVDILLYGGSALVAAGLAAFDGIPLQRDWARVAVWAYAAGALAAAIALSRRRAISPAVRAAVAAVVIGGAALVPAFVHVAARAEAPSRHAQSETFLTEEAASALIRGEHPYAASYQDGPLGRWPASAWLHLPYFPGVMAFGLPRALGAPLPPADARVGFALGAFAVAAAALTLWRPPPHRAITAAVVLLALPPSARAMVAGGDDLPVLALMLLSLVLAARARPAVAGLAIGLAASIKLTAWPLLPFLAVAARTPDGRPAWGRLSGAATAVLAALVLPLALWKPAAFVEDTVLYPLGMAADPTLAGTLTVGAFLGGVAREWVAVGLAAAGVLAGGWFLLLRRPPRDVAGAAAHAAIFTGLVILMAPAGRPGYLIYPVALVVWGALFRDGGVPPRRGAARNADSGHRLEPDGSMSRPVVALLILALASVACGRNSAPADERQTAESPEPDPLVYAGQLVDVLPPDAIAPIDDPRFVSQERASSWLVGREPVVALELTGESRAYPVQILTKHEIVNDEVGGTPVTITYCPLCNSAVAFDRRVKGQVLDFGTSGKLYRSALVMYDRQTESLWTHFDGLAIQGPLTGTRLKVVPVQMLSFAGWRRAFPQGTVLSRDTGFPTSYGENAYEFYDRQEGPYSEFFHQLVDGRLPPMARVVGVPIGDRQVAYAYRDLSTEDGASVVNDAVGGEPIAVFWRAGTASALDTPVIAEGRDVGATGVFFPQVGDRSLTFAVRNGRIVDQDTGSEWSLAGAAVSGPLEGARLRPLHHLDAFWFSWQAYFPDTLVYGVDG
jgi:Protein of unknown function (DUF3179)/Glycosyltransferase family 87